MDGHVYIDSKKSEEGIPLAEYIRIVVKEEIAAHEKRLEDIITAIENDLILSKQHMIKTVEVMSTSFGKELDRLIEISLNGCK